jgi:hypothetical protein
MIFVVDVVVVVAVAAVGAGFGSVEDPWIDEGRLTWP